MLTSPRQRRAGRHRRARLSWWRPRLGGVVEVTVAELVRRGEHERAYAGRARRVRVVPRRRPAPDTEGRHHATGDELRARHDLVEVPTEAPVAETTLGGRR
ncbi:MAG: hypothetical protein ACRDRW_13035 [Pseudonocardiaceae bacterium]